MELDILILARTVQRVIFLCAYFRTPLGLSFPTSAFRDVLIPDTYHTLESGQWTCKYLCTSC